MEYKLTCYKIEMLPRQSAAFPKILESGAAIDLPHMWSRYCDRPLSTTNSIEQYQDCRKSVLKGYKKWIIRYPKFNWNDSAGNMYISKTRWLPTSSSQAFYGIALECAKDLIDLYDIKVTSYVKMKSPINEPSNSKITVLNAPNMQLQKRSTDAAGGEFDRQKRAAYSIFD